jgi:tetratricopeptide (TPR) repeat protein
MKSMRLPFCLLTLLLISQIIHAQTVDEYVSKAENYNRAGELEQAVQVMEEAIQKYPDNSTVYSYLGLYRGIQAGSTKNFMEAGKFIGLSFENLDKAVALDANNPVARFNRGFMCTKVPSFMNKLDSGVEDLEMVLKIYQTSPQGTSPELLVRTYNALGDGYLRQNKKDKAIAAWDKVNELAPGSSPAAEAQQNLAKVSGTKETKPVKTEAKKYTSEDLAKLKESINQDPENSLLYVQLGQACIDTKNYHEAVQVLKKGLAIDSTSAETYQLLIKALSELASLGYNEKIYEDQNYMTNIAFDITNVCEKAVRVLPENMELRLTRGIIGVMMPFFVGKLDEAIKDLEFVSQSNAANETKAEALYWLGYAYQKKATTLWINVIKNYRKTDAAQSAFASMYPPVKHLNPEEYQKPFLAVEFILGFRDELAPQTAVWVEDKKGNFVKTIYVSGFTGYAKEKQINLPQYTRSSKFSDVDGVTAASIDLGQHLYVWDLKDTAGKPVKAGDYFVKVEVSFWPSMEYKIVAAPIKIGKTDDHNVVKESQLIPYLEVNYFAAKK